MDAVANCPKNVSSLHYDTACLVIENDFEFPVDLYTLSSDCYQCDPQFWTTVPLQTNLNLVARAVKLYTLYAFKQDDNESICQQAVLLKQHAIALWKIDQYNCTLSIQYEGENGNMPLHILLMGLVAGLVLFGIFQLIGRSQWIQNMFSRDPVIIDLQNDLGNPNGSSTDSLPLVQSELVPLRRLTSPRIQALDTFRGLIIALMIFVNYGGGKYWFFEHSAWNGLTIADLVFPWFAWVMGVSLVLSYRSKLRSCVSRLDVFVVSKRRAIVLIVLGLLQNSYKNNDIMTQRYCGVLQRLGIAHFVVATLETAFMKKQPSLQYGRWISVSELVDTWRQWLVILSLVGIHLYFSLLHPIPGCPTGYLGPGGIGNHTFAPNCTGGAARYFDSVVFGDAHLYDHSPVKKVYHTTVPYDPEGMLGTLTTCLTVYLGVQAGYIILCYNSTLSRSLRWIFWSILTGLSAGFLCDWSVEGGVIPVNKQLWSLSFALLTSSAAFLLLCILLFVIDHCHWWSGGTFKYAGMNAILLYLGHIITKDTFPWSWKPMDLTNHNEVFIMNIIGVLIWMLIAHILHRRQIFLTI